MQLWKRNLLVLWFANFTVMAGMSLVMPFLPLYIKDLGVTDPAELTKWAGLVFSGTFMTSAIFAPIWGALSDRTGRKIMLIRSALGMAIVMALMGFTSHVSQLFFLRLAMGVVSGFIPAAVSLVATNTPKDHVGYALGTLATGGVSGQIIGPLLGGVLANFLGFRHVFLVTSGLLLAATVIVFVLVKEEFKKPEPKAAGAISNKKRWSDELRALKPVWPMFVVAFLITFSMMMIDPLMSVYVSQLAPASQNVALLAGMVTASTGIANILFSPRLGKLGDRIGYKRVLLIALCGAALMYLPQAFVTAPWQLMICRFGLGMCMGGLLPQVNSLLRTYAPTEMQGRIFGYSTSAMFIGNLCGPNVGGFIGGHYGISTLFFVSFTFLLINAVWLKFVVPEPRPERVKTA
ncbi:multidrug efflux MFS transporter [Tumebacillus permanentifrigoris]|uniref:Putative MFS family arabinose efflux permease n=1 Tax=Tumebacillus permanentifrigoris TaxID=378543 RepID=A0A316DUJ4_9BACL|nr:multidrug efflux MFS transporter [Tumebacillus permanentifrigoris]PWK12732.1 putative MFS family arabinose efflux permease [Tumebacillus permanentifrigoris]